MSAISRPARPHRPDAPPLPAPPQLDATHRLMLQTLDDLAQLVALLAAPETQPQAAELAEKACRFFNRTARAHHELEETQVFPQLLDGADSVLLQHVRRLQQDHMWLEEDWLELEPHLQAIARGYTESHRDFLRDALPEFAAIYREHIALEETVVYPEVQRREAAARLSTA